MVEYKKLFLDEIKSLFLNLVEFSENESMLPKKYPDYQIVLGLDQRPIIIITYDKSTFLTNDSY